MHININYVHKGTGIKENINNQKKGIAFHKRYASFTVEYNDKMTYSYGNVIYIRDNTSLYESSLSFNC